METGWSIGSRWCRWDPHLHAPGTLRNDQFGGDWEGWLAAVESADPPVVALGITDYFTLRTYERAREYQAQGRIPGVLLFPNIELRLTSGTRKHAINLHLLVSPEDEEHVDRAKSLLSRLQYPFRDEMFQCTEVDLRRLGRLHTGKKLPDEQALSEGANQYKVDWLELRRLRDQDSWFRENVLVAIAGGEDGLSGLGKDGAFSAERENLGRFADLVFSSNERDRRFWGGEHPDLEATGDRPKPCLHGSDAHELARVLRPDGDRRCWIRAEPTFDGLRQTLAEPLRRVHIGPRPPGPASEANLIRRVRFKSTGWMRTEEVALNEGLVTVIGPKGTGKTALADLIAFGAHAEDAEPSTASFVGKAKRLLNGAVVEVEWGDGTVTSATWPRKGDKPSPRVRYLSQQFVERLCSSAGVTEPLIEEIESVVFSAIPDEQRMQCPSFGALRDLHLRAVLGRRAQQLEVLREHTRDATDARQELARVSERRLEVAELARAREVVERQIAELPGSDAAVVEAHTAASRQVAALRDAIAAETRKETLVSTLRGEIQRAEEAARHVHAMWQRTFADLGLTEAQWGVLALRPDARAAATLDAIAQGARDAAERLRTQGLDGLVAEEARLSEALGADRANAERRKQLTGQLTRLQRSEADGLTALAKAEGAPERVGAANGGRLDAYEQLFVTLAQEGDALERLYAPLAGQLPRDAKLTFYVHRRVDVEGWAAAGEKLLDLRRPPFNRRGALLDAARTHLLDAWEGGAPSEVRSAMAGFVAEYEERALDALGASGTPAAFAEWLFGTEHVRVEYGIQYEGVPLTRLSPGTRGVVLLTLYLALDRWDERPIVIDQPEENLDPKSVYHDLVPFFREAAVRRQIVMVTHNANLVVNTDSDQVVVTHSERVAPAQLPHIEYAAGGLEDAWVREQVCALLEGGDDAFRRRGRRYGVTE